MAESIAPHPPARPHLERDRTERGDVPVRITLMENRTSGDSVPTLLGEGRLLDPLEIGEPARLAVDNGPVLVTGDVTELARLGPETLRVETQQSVYRLDFLEDRGS